MQANSKGALFTNSWILFDFYISIYIIIGYLSYRFIYTNDIFFDSWNSQLASEHSKDVLSRQRGLERTGYLLFRVVFLKVLLPAFCL